jgi:large subunit ribosomal protein L21
LVRITEILTEGRRPSPIERKARPAAKPVEAAAGEGSESAAADADQVPGAKAAKPKAAAKSKAPAKKPAARKKAAKPAKRGDKK